MIRGFAELFGGGAACTLRLQDGTGRTVPPVGYMGGKRRIAEPILRTLGLVPGEGARSILLCDAGCWGEVWDVATRRPDELAGRFRAWIGRDPSELWRELAAAGRPDDEVDRAAAYLWLQGRAANNSPVWWGSDSVRMAQRNTVGAPCMSHDRLLQPGNSSRGPGLIEAQEQGRIVMPSNGATGPGTTAALERPPRLLMPEGGNRGVKDAVERSHATSGVVFPATVARRLDAAVAALLGAYRVWVARRHPSAYDVSVWLGTPGDLRGVVILLDPPYEGATRYEHTCEREEVVRLALEFAALGATVGICEAEPIAELIALGWTAHDLTGAASSARGRASKPEWVTRSP